MHSSGSNRRDEQIDALIAEYVEERERGNAPPDRDWLEAHPEFRQELQEFLSGFRGLSAGRAVRASVGDGASAPLPDGQFADFRLLSELGRGGMGVVYEAEQISLRRRVALKAIASTGVDSPFRDEQVGSPVSPEMRGRFTQEAELAGGLQHPGIVPVYASGVSAEGQPFYAMRLIEGTSLQAGIDSLHQTSGNATNDFVARLRRLLRHFVDVCNAIEYAHSQQILHRDIKPRNVMLGRFGETLVVDWGLAKDARSHESRAESVDASGETKRETMTQPGGRVGTPAYMSPEQARGGSNEVTTSTDIYGLGATLYCILTGRAPMAGAVTPETMVRIEQGEFPPPRAVNARVPAALEAICLKATSRRPEDRYASAKELAEDVERWLADEPVHAYREPWMTRLQRFLRRHQTLSTSVTAAALIAALSFGVGSWLLGRANDRERTARNDADKSFRLAHESVNKYFTEVEKDDRLLQADLRPLRKELLNSAKEYYEQFVEERSDAPTLRAEMGVALGRLAILVLETEPKGNALPHFERAIEVFEALTVAHPENNEYWKELAVKYNDAGGIYQELGRLEEAEGNFIASLQIREKLAETDKSSNEQSDFAALLGNLGMHYRTRGRLDEAEQYLLRANALWTELVNDPQHSTRGVYHSRTAQARYLLGNLYFTRGDLDQAEECYLASISRYEALAKAAPQYVHLYRELPGVVGNLTNVYFSRLQHDKAEALLSDALARQERFVREQPSVTQHRYDLGSLLDLMSQACAGMGRNDEAADYSRQAAEALRAVAAEHPDIVQYQIAVADAQNTLGLILHSAKRHDEAQSAYRDGLTTAEAIVAAHPELLQPRLQRAALYANLGSSLTASGQPSEGLDWLNRAQAELDDKQESSPQTARKLLTRTLTAKAEAFVRMGRYQDAIQSADAGFELENRPNHNSSLIEVKCEALARAGAADEAFELAMKLNEVDEVVYPERTRQAGCLIVLASAGIPDETARNAMLGKGIALLRTASGVNRAFLEELAKEPALAPIVNTPEFQALLSETADP